MVREGLIYPLQFLIILKGILDHLQVFLIQGPLAHYKKKLLN